LGDYRVNLDVFAGPLDLLLYLIRKEEVDIYDIPISRITEQYICYVDMLKSLDIDLAGSFLVMAATLMQIKSAMLLPKVPDEFDDEDLIDPRAELIRQLLEYKKFKDAANLLSDAAEEQKMRFSRPDSIIEHLKPDSEPGIDIDQASVWDLLEAFDSIMEATGSAVDISRISDETPIDLYQIEILHRLQTEGPLRFEKIFDSKPNRLVMVGLFLALLELIRESLISIKQSSGKLCLQALTDEPPEEAVQKAILTSVEETEEKQTSEEREAKGPPIAISELPAKDKHLDLSAKSESEKSLSPEQTA
jgi:segregation and condensation protein A